jgi:hypothetical protein
MAAQDRREIFNATCASNGRHRERHPSSTRGGRGLLDVAAPEVARRLQAEGVPASEIALVASEVARCVYLMGARGEERVAVRIGTWAEILLARYGDKLCTLLMTTRGRVEAL